jgi:hypothetical protein
VEHPGKFFVAVDWTDGMRSWHFRQTPEWSRPPRYPPPPRRSITRSVSRWLRILWVLTGYNNW